MELENKDRRNLNDKIRGLYKKSTLLPEDMRGNKKTLFFYLVLVDFMIACQFILFSVFFEGSGSFSQGWLVKAYIFSFFLSIFAFGFFSNTFRNYGESEKMVTQGLVFFVIANLICFFSSWPIFFVLGRVLAGLSTGMIFLGQMGVIWSSEPKNFRNFSFGMMMSFFLGFFAGPFVIGFLSGSSLDQVKTSLILGTTVSILAVLAASLTLAKIKGASSYIQAKRERLGIRGIIREKFWLIFKYLFLFAITTWFVSRNFGGLETGLLVAAGVTGLSIAHSKIFDAASDAFLEVEEEDDVQRKAQKTIIVIVKRFFYTALDYGLAGLSVALVVAAINFGFSYWTTIGAMWLIIDLPSAAILVGIYEKTGRDMTLGRSYRRMANAILSQSKAAGIVVFIYEITLASFWSGPDYTVIFFKDELKTRIRTILALLAITVIHSILWTSVYWYGYEDLAGLARKLISGG